MLPPRRHFPWRTETRAYLAVIGEGGRGFVPTLIIIGSFTKRTRFSPYRACTRPDDATRRDAMRRNATRRDATRRDPTRPDATDFIQRLIAFGLVGFDKRTRASRDANQGVDMISPESRLDLLHRVLCSVVKLHDPLRGPILPKLIIIDQLKNMTINTITDVSFHLFIIILSVFRHCRHGQLPRDRGLP